MRKILLCEGGVARDKNAFQWNQLEQFQCSFVLVGLGIYREFYQGRTQRIRVCGQQVDAGDFSTPRSAQGFAIDMPQGIMRRHLRVLRQQPFLQSPLENIGIKGLEKVVKRADARRFIMGEAHGFAQFPPPAAELRYVSQRLRPAKDRRSRQRQHGRQRMPRAARITRIGQTQKQLVE